MTSVTGGARRLRALLAGLCAFAALSSLSADAAPPVPVLGEVVTVQGSRSGYVPVTLPKNVNFRAENGREISRPSVRFTGGAYGWLLQADPTGPTSGFAGHVKMPAAEGGSVVFRMDGTNPRTGEYLFETNVLPAGRYRLYLLTSGTGSVRFRLPGLRGSRALVARAPSAARTVTDLVPTVGGVGPPAYAHGTTIESTGKGTQVLAFDWVHTVAQAAAHYASCYYKGGPPGGRWLPGCPGGDTTITGVYGVFMGCCGTGFGGAWLPPGRWGVGRWYDTAGAVDRAGLFLVIIPQT